MECLHAIFGAHRNHEPISNETAAPTRCRRLVGRAPLRLRCRQDAGSTLKLMEPPHATSAAHWDHEPLAVPRWTKSADKSDALQRLRARGGVSGLRGSVWSACGFSAAFPRQAAIRWPG